MNKKLFLNFQVKIPQLESFLIYFEKLAFPPQSISFASQETQKSRSLLISIRIANGDNHEKKEKLATENNKKG